MTATATPGELRTRRHEANGCPSSRPAAEARVRFRKTARSPRFKASGSDAVFFHFRIPAAVLQPHVGYPLDLMDGHEVVSWVAFRRENFHCPALSFLGKWPWRPFADERFLNVRPHVRHRGESGILFLAEFLSPPLRRRRALGPAAFTVRRDRRCCFRIWNKPWPMADADPADGDTQLLVESKPRRTGTQSLGAHCALGATDVWMSRPLPCEEA